MSTRANIIIEEDNEKLYFYRHSDGYPEGAMPLIVKFLEGMRSGKIRDNIGQAAGWLILLGAIEYNQMPEFELEEHENLINHRYGDVASVKFSEDNFSGWKVGAIEPTTGLHGDIEYKYVIDVKTKNVECFERQGDWNNPKWIKIPVINIGGYKPSEFKSY